MGCGVSVGCGVVVLVSVETLVLVLVDECDARLAKPLQAPQTTNTPMIRSIQNNGPRFLRGGCCGGIG